MSPDPPFLRAVAGSPWSAQASRRSFMLAAVGAAASLGAAALPSQRAFGAEVAEVAGTAGAAGVAGLAAGSAQDARPTVGPFATPSVAEPEPDGGSPESKRVLVVVDYQVDFVDGGAFGRIEPALAIEDALYERVKAYQEAGDIVIYTMDTHPQAGYELTREGQVNPPHCVPGTPGWQVYGKLAELLTPERAIRLMKGTYGAPDLPFVVQAIHDQGTAIELIEVAGVSTTCRVLHNAILLYTYFPEALIVLDRATTASYSDEATDAQLDEMEGWGFTIRR